MQLNISSYERSTLLTEADPRVASFRYANYDTDPKPRVLVMGKYTPASTGNELVAGINLNYLSQGQSAKLAQYAGKLFGDGSLKVRYRRLKKVLPDISQYYRTYNADHISMITVDDFLAKPSEPSGPSATELQGKPSQPKGAVGAKKPEPKPTKPASDPDTDRQQWQTKRRHYDPQEPKRRTSPERHRDDSDLGQATSRAKNARYRQQQRQDRRQAELEREVAQDDMQPPEPESYEPDEMDDMYAMAGGNPFDDEVREDRYGGVIAITPQQYIITHSPSIFLPEDSKQITAVQNIKTGQIVVDAVPDSVDILVNAGWQYEDTIRYEIQDGLDGESLRILYDCDDETAQKLVREFVQSDSCGLLLLHSKING